MNNQNQYEEISLVELVVVWLGSWKLATFVTCVIWLLGFAVVFIVPDKFDSKVQLQIGMLEKETAIQQPELLVSQLKAEHKIGDKTLGQRPFPRIETVSYDKQSETQLVEITARAKSPGEAVALLEKVTGKIQQHHKDTYTSILEEQLKLKDELEQYLSSQRSEELKKSDRKEIDLSGVIESISKIKTKISMMRESKPLSPPSIPVVASTPNKSALYALVFLLGLVAAVITPFIIKFILSVKEELKKQAS